MAPLKKMLTEILACNICEEQLPQGARPVLQFHPKARILIAGQAPGRKVHDSGVPFDDASGDRLREWMGVTREVFYDSEKIAILPMGFCYPGSKASGDLPPRPECAVAWREKLLGHLEHLEVTLVLGRYAQGYHINTTNTNMQVTETVRAWPTYWPTVIPLPHPTPRNNIWIRRNPWFEAELVPALRKRVAEVLREN